MSNELHGKCGADCINPQKEPKDFFASGVQKGIQTLPRVPKPSSFVGCMIPVIATKSYPFSTKSATGKLLAYRVP